MNDMDNSGNIIANDLIRAERSINLAMRDTAQLLTNLLDATEIHKVTPSMVIRTVKATVATLVSLTESQQQLSVRAHLSAERVGIQLGLAETNWGENLPKPSNSDREELDKTPSNIPVTSAFTA